MDNFSEPQTDCVLGGRISAVYVSGIVQAVMKACWFEGCRVVTRWRRFIMRGPRTYPNPRKMGNRFSSQVSPQVKPVRQSVVFICRKK